MSERIEIDFKDNGTPSPRLERRSGYTLAEMLVVLAIVALMAVIVVPRFAIRQKGAGLKSGATEVMTALRTARRMAITKREMRALALDIYSIPAQFAVMKLYSVNPDVWVKEGEFHALPNNVAIVAVVTTTNLSWTTLDVTRTDDVDLNGIEDTPGTDETIFNPQLKPDGTPGPNNIVNPIYHLIRFEPTGTADKALIYLWNIEDGRRALPAVTEPQSLSNLHTLGVPPGFLINANNQGTFFKLPDDESPDDAFYYTLAVSPITGTVTAYDYAWGTGATTDEWDRKKDGK